MRGVVAVEKLVDNFDVIEIEAERLLKINWQRFVTLIFTYRRIFGVFFRPIFNPFLFLQLRCVACNAGANY